MSRERVSRERCEAALPGSGGRGGVRVGAAGRRADGGRGDARNRGRALRRRRLAVAAALLLGIATVAGLYFRDSERRRALAAAERFAVALEHRDLAALAATTTARDGRRPSRAALERVFADQWATATVAELDAGKPRVLDDGRVELPLRARTRIFGTVSGTVTLRLREGRVAVDSGLAFPRMRPGERLARREQMPPRAPILARDGTPLAAGPAFARSSPLGAAALPVVGALAPPDDAAARERLYAAGLPRTWPVGRSGLERAFERELRGRPGGELLSGGRVIARARARAAPPLRTTIDPLAQRAAVIALGARYGGIAVVDARSGEVRALAGIAASGPQPPGSVFKIATVAAALEGGVTRPDARFPVAQEAQIDGVPIRNANDEPCGGTLIEAFARSCNSVFAPLGVRVGAERLVRTAERLGFNRPPGIPGAASSVLPRPRELRSRLELAATAIGQGRVLATALGMASVTQAVANGGIRTAPQIVVPSAATGERLRAGGDARPERVLASSTAATLRAMMRAVVTSGTGLRAALPTVAVAGKTGTAELESRPRGAPPESDDPSRTDAWFCGFAPYRSPRYALCVLLVRAGSGGETAAPVAREVFAALLARPR